LGKALIENKGCICDGLDCSDEVLSYAKEFGYRNVFNVDINSGELNISEIRNDVIILADILEHLANPWKALSEISRYLASNGILIISLPNIAFVSSRIMLLLGEFRYEPKGGIMDEDHLRFFNASTAREMCERAGLSVSKFFGYALVRPRYFFLRPLAKIWPNLFALQFLIICRKRP
jgi:2-polyprenyl-3-methyl-5-hydroxy-6-metoxy-1,4-benzoquinol methylase